MKANIHVARVTCLYNQVEYGSVMILSELRPLIGSLCCTSEGQT